MYYATTTDDYYKTPVTYIPVYSTGTDRSTRDKLNDDLTKVKKELTELRGELYDLRLEKESCRLCTSTSRRTSCDGTCSICYPRYRLREKEEIYSGRTSPVHYCSICDDYVIDRVISPPLSAYDGLTIRNERNKNDDKLSEYLSRQSDLGRLRTRYIPEERPVWIPTAYKHDYPYRRWTTRHVNSSNPDH